MSLLLDALKQAANSKTQAGGEPDKTASKKTGASDSSQQPNSADSADEIKLELEDITEEPQQDSELGQSSTGQSSNIQTTTEESSNSSAIEEPLSKESIPVEMEHFDPNAPLDHTEEHITEPSYSSSHTTIEPKAGEVDLKIEEENELDAAQQAKISIPQEEKPEPIASKDNKVEKKSRVLAPENAKIILNPDKKPKRSGTVIAICFLIFAVLAAGGFLGYLYYLEQDNKISTNIANLSRSPTAQIKPIGDLSNVSDQISQVNQQSQTPEAANQTLKGNIATADGSNDISEIQQATKKQAEQAAQKQVSTTATAQNNQAINNEDLSNQALNNGALSNQEISAEELPPTLSSVVNSHPFIEHKPLKQLPVAMEKPISIKKNNNEALASKNISLGYKQFENGNYQLAKKYYQKALKLAPNDTDIFLGLAAIALIENDTDTAAQLYTKALQIDPNNNTAISAVSTLQKQDRSDESTIKENIQANPNNPWAYFNLGNHHMEEQNWTKALHAFSKANTIAPQTPDILFNIAISLDNLDRIPQAVEAYNMAIYAAKTKPANFDVTAAQKYVDSLNLQQGNK